MEQFLGSDTLQDAGISAGLQSQAVVMRFENQIITRANGQRTLISRAVSRPLSCGISVSMIIRSGGSDATKSST